MSSQSNHTRCWISGNTSSEVSTYVKEGRESILDLEFESQQLECTSSRNVTSKFATLHLIHGIIEFMS